MMKPRADKQNAGLDTAALVIGFILGLIVGGLGALFNAPRSGSATRQQIAETGENLRSKLEAADPISESIAQGKAAARRRRSEMGLDKP